MMFDAIDPNPIMPTTNVPVWIIILLVVLVVAIGTFITIRFINKKKKEK